MLFPLSLFLHLQTQWTRRRSVWRGPHGSDGGKEQYDVYVGQRLAVQRCMQPEIIDGSGSKSQATGPEQKRTAAENSAVNSEHQLPLELAISRAHLARPFWVAFDFAQDNVACLELFGFRQGFLLLWCHCA